MCEHEGVTAFAEGSLVDGAGNKLDVKSIGGGVALEVFGREVLSPEEAQRVLESADAAILDDMGQGRSDPGRLTNVKDDVSGEDEATAAAELTRDEKLARLEKAVRAQPSHREIYFHILEMCDEPQELSVLEAHIAALPEFKMATFDQYLMICILEKNEGLARIEMTEQGEVVTPQMKEGLDEDGVDDLVSSYWFQTTDLGRQLFQRNDPFKRIGDLLKEVPARRQSYLDVLDLCRQKRSYKDIESLLQGRDVLWMGREGLQQPLQPSVFVDKLERAGAIVWNDGWSLTEKGLKILEEVGA